VATLLPPIPELTLVGVFDRGVPNRERIVLKAETTIEVGNYAVVLGIRYLHTGVFVPIQDAMFWFGSGAAVANDWLFLFTGSGTFNSIPNADGTGKIYLSYWGREHTLFHDPTTEAVLWRINGANFPPPPVALTQASPA
jgi:hypothetical protein